MADRTPAAEWRNKGEPDPHGTRYDCERAALAMGNLTDDELANGVFLHGDGTHGRAPITEVVAGRAFWPIAWLTAAKDRIRWLSRALERERTRNSDLMLLAAADLESWMKSYNRDAATEDLVKRLRDAAAGVAGTHPGEGWVGVCSLDQNGEARCSKQCGVCSDGVGVPLHETFSHDESKPK